MKRAILVLLSTFVFVVSVSSAQAEGRRESSKLNDAVEVVEQIVTIPEKGIPPALLGDAEGIAIIPGVIKAGFIVGGRYGTGILMIRNKETGWSNPVFITLAGGSIGWQIGVESIDIILVFRTSRSVSAVLRSTFTLGADASVAAGPVGRTAGAATDVQLKSEILTYSRTRGLFAGLALEGASLQMDHDADDAFYNERYTTPRDITSGKYASSSPEVTRLKELLNRYSSPKKQD